jgi:hypothetical protein
LSPDAWYSNTWSLSGANHMHSDAASQGDGWWQGCGAAYQNEQHDQHVAMKADRTSTGRF